MRAEAMIAARSPRKRFTEHLLAAAAALLAVALMTWPLARDAGDHVLKAAYHWDAYTNAMIMGGRVDAVLGHGPLSLHDNYFFAPLPSSIVFNENLFGLSLLFAPFYLATNNPLLAYNFTLLVSMATSVFFTYLLVRRLTKSGLAGILAGIAFAFSPYVMFELGRIQLVATQWIPACFLLLHRAIEERRRRDVFGFWICYLLQIGTCLYYAMFLIPLLALVGVVLSIRTRPPRRLLIELAAVGGLAGVIALFAVYPYFTARGTFSLERSLAFASSYDGQLEFFSNVPESNLGLPSMRGQGNIRGAYEEVAFPGFTVLAMFLLSLLVALGNAFRNLGAIGLSTLIIRWFAIGSMSMTLSLLSHSMLAGALIFAIGIWHQSTKGEPLPFHGRNGLYLGLLLLSTALFLGLFPAKWGDEPVHGLYYYFHTYFPGFNGIRKVSRQAVMTTFVLCILASFGSAWLFSLFAKRWKKALVLTVLLATTCFELRSFPHPMKKVWAGETVPKAYHFLSTLPANDLVTIAPQNDGVKRFWGDRGMALHNYLALYHKHRFLNGQSSWLPPVTDLVRRAMIHLPDEGARRALQSVGARHLLIHAADLKASRRHLPELLEAQPQHFKRVFHEGSDSVFTLATPNDPSLSLMEIPELPKAARQIPSQRLRASGQANQAFLAKSIDGDLKTLWAAGRLQKEGQYFELVLDKTRSLVAFEIENPGAVMQVPLSFELMVKEGDSEWKTVARQAKLRLFREQVYSPKSFVFRVVLDEPVPADRLRITIQQPSPGFSFKIHEARLYELPR